MIPHPNPKVTRKATLVALGQWALATGRVWLVLAATKALRKEGLSRV
jgi:hypothetical protein